MVPPLLPPVLVFLSYVPLLCQAIRIAMGQALAFWLIRARRISDLSASMLTSTRSIPSGSAILPRSAANERAEDT